MATPFGSPVLQSSRSITPRTSFLGKQESLPANTNINVTEWEDIRKVLLADPYAKPLHVGHSQAQR